MFYVLIFGILAVVLVVSFFVTRSRRNSPSFDGPSGGHASSASGVGADHNAQVHHATSEAAKKKRKAERAQSRHDRRKRH
jgi:hypothetical protein